MKHRIVIVKENDLEPYYMPQVQIKNEWYYLDSIDHIKFGLKIDSGLVFMYKNDCIKYLTEHYNYINSINNRTIKTEYEEIIYDKNLLK
jgi:hypothetical protein